MIVAAIVMVVLMVPIILILVGRPPVHSSVTVAAAVSGCAIRHADPCAGVS